MDTSDFLPSPEALEQIRRDLAVYEEKRKLAHVTVRRRVPLIVGAYAAAVLVVAFLLRDIPIDNRYFYLSAAVLGALVFGGIGFYSFARQPATELQEQFRAELFRSIFSFIENLRHWRGSRPGSFDRLPREAVGSFNDQIFDDEITGRMGDLRFNLYEADLQRRSGKSSRTVFKGVVLAFDLAQPFPGKLIVTRRSHDISQVLRDVFGRNGVESISSGDRSLEKLYEFRTDNEAAAMPLIAGPLGQALNWLREAWPDEPARLALSEGEGFLLLPVTGGKNFFELPDVAIPPDYSAHIAPMIVDMAKLLAIGDLVRKATEPERD